MRYLGRPAECGAYALMLVERHRYALARAAKADAALQFAALDRIGQRMREVGIVDALGRIGAEVDDLESLRSEITHKKTL